MPQLKWFIDDIQDEGLIVGIRPTRQGEGVSIVLNAAKSQQLCDALQKAIQEADDEGDGLYVPRSQAILTAFYTAAQIQADAAPDTITSDAPASALELASAA
jgi:hypothetical protein